MSLEKLVCRSLESIISVYNLWMSTSIFVNLVSICIYLRLYIYMYIYIYIYSQLFSWKSSSFTRVHVYDLMHAHIRIYSSEYVSWKIKVVRRTRDRIRGYFREHRDYMHILTTVYIRTYLQFSWKPYSFIRMHVYDLIHIHSQIYRIDRSIKN